MYALSEEELERVLSFENDEYTKGTEEEKNKMRDAYRKLEVKSNEQIKNAGGRTNWYDREGC